MSQTLALVVVTLASLTYWTAGDATANNGDVLFECNFDQKTMCGLKSVTNWKLLSKSEAISGEPGPVTDTSGNGYFLATDAQEKQGGLYSYVSSLVKLPRRYTEGQMCISFSFFKYGTSKGTFHFEFVSPPWRSTWTIYERKPTKKWITIKRTFNHVSNDTIQFATYTRYGQVAGYAMDDLKVTKGQCP